MSRPPIFPTPLQAALLSSMVIFFAVAVRVVAADSLSPTASYGLAMALAYAAAGALGATSVPPPHGERIGLRGVRARHLVALLLLLPVALLVSEVDNLVRAATAAAAPAAERTIDAVPADANLALLETVVVIVGLAPLLEEWFFRGLVQQGLVARAGAAGGIFLASLYYGFTRCGLSLSLPDWPALLAQSFALGLALGFVRHATGSVVASLLLHTGVNALGVLALAAPERIAIPGFNAPGPHTPLVWLGPSALAVAVGVWLLAREPAPAAPPIPPRTAEPE